MSILRKTKNIADGGVMRRFSDLAAMGEVVFHSGDLANLWQIANKNTLNITLKRYADKKLIYRIWRGMYAIKPVEQIDPYFLGIKAMRGYSYVSVEAILFQHGIISQSPGAITMISSVTRRFSIGKNNYYCRQLGDEYVFNSAGIFEKDNIRQASPERAAADLLYFNPQAHFDMHLDWKKIKKIQKQIGYPPTINRYQKNANS